MTFFDMKNLPHDIILEAFKTRYSNSPKASLDHLFTKFSNGTSEKMKSELIKEILDALQNKGYLKWYVSRRNNNKEPFIWNETFKDDFANEKSPYCFYDLKDTHISASLTPDGIDYALDIDRKRVQHNNNRLAIIFAGLTVILSFFSLYKTIITQRELDNKLQILQTKLHSQDSLLQNSIARLNLNIEKDSLENSKKKDMPTLKQNKNIVR